MIEKNEYDSYTKKIKAKYLVNSMGQKSGPFTTYYENGAVKERGCYINGLLCGVYKRYYPNGQCEEVLTYNENGKRDGVYRRFYPDGKECSVCHYKNGVLHGYFVWYEKNGKAIEKGDYVHGKFFDYKRIKNKKQNRELLKRLLAEKRKYRRIRRKMSNTLKKLRYPKKTLMQKLTFRQAPVANRALAVKTAVAFHSSEKAALQRTALKSEKKRD